MQQNLKLWKSVPTLDEMNALSARTIHEALGIQFTELGEDFLEATMPVDHRTHQPSGLLHGGASVVLAESLGSVASLLHVGVEEVLSRRVSCVGIEINANHLRSIQSGTVRGRATPVRIGKTLHVWNIQIYDVAQGHEICRSRLTVMVQRHSS